MAKYYGTIGYAKTQETSPGIWEEVIIKKNYYGDIIRNGRKIENSDSINDSPNIDNSISIVSDAYAYENIFAMRYITWMGVKWKIRNVDVQPPRLILSIGGVYNERS